MAFLALFSHVERNLSFHPFSKSFMRPPDPTPPTKFKNLYFKHTRVKFLFISSPTISPRKKMTHQPESPSSRSLQRVNAREGVEKRELYYTVGKNVNWCNHCGKQYAGTSEN